MRYARRPRCTECKAAFTYTVAGGGVHRLGRAPSGGPSGLCGDCDQRRGTDWEDAWPDATREEQEPAVPEQKATGWLSRPRS